MKHPITWACAAIIGLASFGAKANLVSGSIEYYATAGESSIDYWDFTTTGGQTSFDVLAFESLNVDHNGDNNLDTLDSYIVLLTRDGNGDYEITIAVSDDDLGVDASSSVTDSFLSLDLLAGSYTLAISSPVVSREEIRSGFNVYDGDFSRFASGDYQINAVNANLTSSSAVPEPSIIALFGLGLVGLGFARRRRQA